MADAARTSIIDYPLVLISKEYGVLEYINMDTKCDNLG
ncbi:hypothetical protein HNQ54_000817 [Anaerocolumna cellulosilytica]|nr:hypothetical protein [Anaerocolumna cellulosilytica]